MALSLTRDPAERRLWSLTAILFVSYLCVGVPLSTVPIFVTRALGFNNAWAGLAVGVAFASTILTRGYAGAFSDRRSPKLATARGLVLYAAGALTCLVAGLTVLAPPVALAVLLVGRLVLGLGESLMVVGLIAWAIALVGPARSGKVLAFMGAAMYGALAVGGPIGLALLDRFGFTGAMALGVLLPCFALLAISPIPDVKPIPAAARPSFWSVIGRIWPHGSVLCLQGVGFAAIGAFFALYFLKQNWSYAGLGLTAFGGGFVLVRIFFGHLPDRIGGLPVAIASLTVEVIGQTMIWVATGPTIALLGAFFTGLGCSMIFPAMGREVVRRVEPQLRGTALGGFAAFQDLAYGLTGPVAGLLADRAGYGSVFLIGGLAAATGLLITLRLRRAQASAPIS